jgi:hypothetical protein
MSHRERLNTLLVSQTECSVQYPLLAQWVWGHYIGIARLSHLIFLAAILKVHLDQLTA